MKRVHDDSSDDDDVKEKPIKKSASSSTTSVQTGTRVEREGKRRFVQDLLHPVHP